MALRRILSTTVLLLAGLLLSTAHAGLDADIKCRRDLGKGYRKLVDTNFRYVGRCRESRARGEETAIDCEDLAPSGLPALKPVRKAEEKLARFAERSCADAASPFRNGLGFCPAPCGDHPNETYPGVVSCLQCLARERVSDAIETAYGATTEAGEKDDLKCLVGLGKATRKLLDRRQKVQQRCQFLADRAGLDASCAGIDSFVDPRGDVARFEEKLLTSAGNCSAASLGRLPLCAQETVELGACLANELDRIGEDLFRDLQPEPVLLVESPAQGSFSTAGTVEVHGSYGGASPERFTVYVNEEVATSDGAGGFQHTIAGSPEILQPVVVELRRTSTQEVLRRQRRTLHRTDPVALAASDDAGLSLRLTDRGLDRLEPLLKELVEIDLAALLPPGTLVIDDYEYFCLGGCLTTDVTVNPSNGSSAPPPSLGGFSLGVDARAAGVGYAAADITLENLAISARVVELGCDINITSNTATLSGNFDLWWKAARPTQIDVTQLGGVGVSFSGFSAVTDCGDGFGSGLLESLIDNLLGDVEALVRDAFTGFLDAPAPGEEDPPIAAAIEFALADFEIEGLLGNSLGVAIDAPIADIPIDNEGITIRNHLALQANTGGGSGQCTPPAGAVVPAGVVGVPGTPPAFGIGTPLAGRAYDVALSLSRTVFNQLLAAEAQCGLLVGELDSLLGAPLDTTLLGVLFPEVAARWPQPRPARVLIKPGLAPFLTDQAGPNGELAELRLGHLGIELVVEEAAGDFSLLELVVDIRAGLESGFDNRLGVLSFALAPIQATDLQSIVLENPLGLNESVVAVALGQLLPAALPTIGSALGSFPIPDILGKAFYGLETAPMSGNLAVFADLLPPGTLRQFDFTGADFATSSMVLVGNALWVEDAAPFFQPNPFRLRLTSNNTNQQGAAWHADHRIDASRDWQAVYQFQLSFQGAAGADGLGFHLQSDGLGANPDESGGGLAGPRISVVVDTYNNGPEGTEESLYVLVNGGVVYFNNLLDFPGDPTPGSSPTVFRMELGYRAPEEELRVALFDEGSNRFLDERVSVDLRNLGPAHAGFSARTGGASQNHDVRSFRLGGSIPVVDFSENYERRARDFTGGDYQSADMALVGDAFWMEDGAPIFSPWPRRLRLTDNGGGRNGAAWDTVSRWDASRDWSAISRVQITFGGPDGAEGLGFHLQSDGPTANPNHAGFGLGGQRLSVVIDTWDNGDEGTGESLQVWLGGQRIYLQDLADSSGEPRPGSSPSVFRLEVRHVAALKRLELRLIDESGGGYFEDVIGLNLAGWGGMTAGFSATTGGSAENHDVRTFEFSGVPVP